VSARRAGTDNLFVEEIVMTMTATEAERQVQTLYIRKETLIAAPAAIVFETMMEPMGPLAEMKMKMEALVGGRWYRDLGDGAGHLWGHVQVIKPPKLLELSGPMMMSYPAMNHLQYRLTEEGKMTRLTLTHQAMGLITDDHRKGVSQGWEMHLAAIQAAAQGRV